jgi:hypothetical protein
MPPPCRGRLQEIENPELAAQRMREIYRQKGYSEAWIEKRMRGIAVRDELTDEWKKRGVREQAEYAILTAEISKATFGMTPTEYRDHKALAYRAQSSTRSVGAKCRWSSPKLPRESCVTNTRPRVIA